MPICLSAQSNGHAKADSLRLLRQYSNELALRKKYAGNKDFETKLAEANFLLSANEIEKAGKVLFEVSAQSPSQEFWKTRTVASLLSKKENNAEAWKITENLKVKPGSLEEALKFIDLSAYSNGEQTLNRIEYLEKASGILSTIGFKNHYLNGFVLNDMAYYYDEASIPAKVFETQHKALEIFVTHYPQDFSMITTTHNNAVYYFETYGDIKKTELLQHSFDAYMNTFFSAKDKSWYQTSSKNSFVHGTALYYLNVLRYSGLKFNPDRLEIYIKKMESHFEDAPKDWADENLDILYAAYDIIYYYLQKNKQYDKALIYAKKLNSHNSNLFYEMKKNAGQAMVNYYTNKNDNALYFVDKSLKTLNFPPTSTSLQTLLVLKAEVLSRLGRIEASEAIIAEIYKNILERDAEDYLSFRTSDFKKNINISTIKVLIKSGNTYKNIFERVAGYLNTKTYLKNFTD